MKTGRSIQELAAEIQRQADAKRDFLAPTEKMQFHATELDGHKSIELRGINSHSFPLTDHAHSQVATETKLPKQYYDRMLDQAPELLALNVNHWFQAEPKRRLVRTLDHNVRAFLSDKFPVHMDYLNLAEAALPVLAKRKAVIKSAEVTEKRLYIKAVLPSLQAEVVGSRKVGDIVCAGVAISTSEIGAGKLKIEDWIERLSCLNGMLTTSVFARVHIGPAYGEEAVRELLSQETRSASDKAFQMVLRDMVANAFDEETFYQTVARFSITAGRMIEGSPEKVVDQVQELFTFSDGTRGNVMRHLIEGGDISQWGLANAVTRAAEDEESYDSATDLERAGGKIIDLSKSEWTTLSRAA